MRIVLPPPQRPLVGNLNTPDPKSLAVQRPTGGPASPGRFEASVRDYELARCKSVLHGEPAELSPSDTSGSRSQRRPLAAATARAGLRLPRRAQRLLLSQSPAGRRRRPGVRGRCLGRGLGPAAARRYAATRPCPERRPGWRPQAGPQQGLLRLDRAGPGPSGLRPPTQVTRSGSLSKLR